MSGNPGITGKDTHFDFKICIFITSQWHYQYSFRKSWKNPIYNPIQTGAF